MSNTKIEIKATAAFPYELKEKLNFLSSPGDFFTDLITNHALLAQDFYQLIIDSAEKQAQGTLDNADRDEQLLNLAERFGAEKTAIKESSQTRIIIFKIMYGLLVHNEKTIDEAIAADQTEVSITVPFDENHISKSAIALLGLSQIAAELEDAETLVATAS